MPQIFALLFQQNLSWVDARRSDGTRIFTDATEKHGSQLSERIGDIRVNPCPIGEMVGCHRISASPRKYAMVRASRAWRSTPALERVADSSNVWICQIT